MDKSFSRKKNEAFTHKEILKKLKNSSLMSRFTGDDAIQFKVKSRDKFLSNWLR